MGRIRQIERIGIRGEREESRGERGESREVESRGERYRMGWTIRNYLMRMVG